jgi:hypothetical protein
MGTDKKTLALTDLRGGMNDTDPPMLLGDRQVVDAVNVDYYDGGLCRKRGGTRPVSYTYTGGPYAAAITSLAIHTPATGDLDAVLWAMDNLGNLGGQVTGGGDTEFAVQSTDAALGNRNSLVGVSFNSKFFLAYDTVAVNRLHCWDGTTFRRVGVATPAAPTAADSGAGAYAETIRYYKVSYAEKSGTTVVRRSELSPVLSHTPGPGHAGVTVTKPATITEGETHWELWGSADNLVFYFIVATVVGTTTYVDSAAPSSYSAGAVEPLVNSNLPPPAAKYIVTDGNRLIMAGCHQTSGGYITPKNSRVWFTPVLGSLDIGDDERIPLDHYLDLDEQDGSIISGLAYYENAVWVFKTRSIWKLIPTGNSATPYQATCFSRKIGTLSHHTILHAPDQNGDDALYFLSARGPMRLGVGGVAFVGHGISRWWDACSGYAFLAAWRHHSVYHEDKSQIWWWMYGSASDTRLWILDVSGTGYGAWSSYVGTALTSVYCSIYSAWLETAPNDHRKPLVGCQGAYWQILALDTGTQDITSTVYGGGDPKTTTAFQAYLTTKPYALGGIGRNFGLGAGHLVAREAEGVTITVTTVCDYGLETRTSTVDLSPEASETAVIRKLEGMDGAGLNAVQFTIGDADASPAAWTLDALVVPYDVEEPR